MAHPASSSAPDDETIHRVLFVGAKVHVYAIPPLQSTKGHVAAGWTTNPQHHIFTARLRVVESSAQGSSSGTQPTSKEAQHSGVSAAIQLEDPASGELFAAAPYTSAAAVEAATDSARFFAVRVVGDGGRKATLGIGFEERGDALDFGLALTEARRALGWEGGAAQLQRKNNKTPNEPKKDWGLKDGETLTVDLKGLRHHSGGSGSGEGGATWSVPEGAGGLVPPPPPPAGADTGGLLPPPPSAREARAERRRSREIPAYVQEEEKRKLEALGFDDGEFGEFQ